MPKWKPEECGKITDDTGAFLGRANSDADAGNLCSDHNADIDALTAERDELQAIIVAPPGLNEWSHDGDKITAIYSHRPAYAKSEADAKYLVRCHNHNLQMIHERECERDELQRRLDAVVAKISEAVVSDDDCVCSMLCHSAILAIAEGREG